jgi:hypothetical protein
MEEYGEAASLIITLKNDPVFPKRLQSDWKKYRHCGFITQMCTTALRSTWKKHWIMLPIKRRARWERIAQLYQLSGNSELARKFYEKVIGHTIDPVMQIYARLNSIRIDTSGGENYY